MWATQELKRLTGIEVDLAGTRAQLDEAEAQVEAAESQVSDANQAFFAEEKAKMEAFNQRKSARKQAATALSDADALGRERDTWKFKYRQAVAAMEDADKRAAAATATQTELRHALEQAVKNAELLKTEKRRAEADGKALAQENSQLGQAVEEEHSKLLRQE